MKVLMLEWNSFGNEDIVTAFMELGYDLKRIPFSNKELHYDEEIINTITAEIKSYSPDFVFSFNYFPIISHACKKADCRYAA